MNKNSQTSFPQTFEYLETNFLIEVYERGADRVRHSIDGLTEADLVARPLSDKWTIKEILAHLVDSEIMGTLRIRFTLAEPNSNFIVYNQDVWAKTLNYQILSAEDLEITLSLFENLRRFNTSFFQRIEKRAWQNTGIHPEVGEVTLRNLLELYADHSEKHIGHILRLRQLLEKPLLSIDKLLEKSLFE